MSQNRSRWAFWEAAGYVAWRTAANRGAQQIRRIREPRYAVGVSAAVAYLWFGVSRWGAAPLDRLHWSALGLELLALLAVGGAWVFGGDDAVLRFTEAEIQHLFPAPVTRRELLLYKVLRGAVAAVPYALVTTVFVGGRVTDHPGAFVVGAWIGFLILDLHLSGASLARAALGAAGLSGLRRRLSTALALVGVASVLGWAATRVRPPPVEGSFSTWVDWAAAAIVDPPLGVVLVPVRAPVDLALSQDLGSFSRGLCLSLVVLAAHVGWLLASPAAFEDGTIQSAERLATRRKGGQGAFAVRLTSVRLPLGSLGRPEVALVWKGVIASFRLAPVRLAVGLGSMFLVLAILAFGALGDSPGGAAGAAAIVAGSMAGYLALFGSGLLRVDLRMDLDHVELLRALPLTGRGVVTGEILGPAAVLITGEWLCLAAAFVLCLPWPGEPPIATRLGGIAALAVGLPVLTLCSLVVQNGAALLYPEWERQGGFDAVGRRLLALITNLMVLLLALGPGLVFAAPALLLAPWIGALSFPLAAACGAAPVLGAVWFALGRMGRWMEALDPSAR